MSKPSKESKAEPLGGSVATKNVSPAIQRDAVFTFFTGVHLGLNTEESGE